MRTFPLARLIVDAPQTSAMRRNSVARWLKHLATEFDRYEGEVWTTGPFRARSYLGNEIAVSTLRITAPGCLSDDTRARLAKWMRSRAKHLTGGRGVFEGRWFVQEFRL